MNNGKCQSAKNIFFQQPNWVKAETLNTSVVQEMNQSQNSALNYESDGGISFK